MCSGAFLHDRVETVSLEHLDSAFRRRHQAIVNAVENHSSRSPFLAAALSNSALCCSSQDGPAGADESSTAAIAYLMTLPPVEKSEKYFPSFLILLGTAFALVYP
jgi:hypothetical protein